MRSDHLKSHMNKHADLSSKDSKQLCKDIQSSKDETSMYREKPKDPHSDGLDESPLLGDEIDDKELKKRLAHDDYYYTKKRKLGVKVAKLIHENGYHPDSLRSEYKEALDLHLKKRVMNSFPENIEFKPWYIHTRGG